jgi:4'-phosphopantetheinyl transferase
MMNLWLPGAQLPSLGERDAHVWRIALDAVSPSVERLEDWLSADERSRAQQCAEPGHRRRFIASRTVLRHLLAWYHDVLAADVPLALEAGGRPFVEGATDLFFSLTHTADIALVALARGAVGVDAERVRPVDRADTIARRVLHTETVTALAAMPPTLSAEGFIDAWTQREAHVKAVGGGLFRTPDALPFDPAQPADASVYTIRSRIDDALWSVARFLPYDGIRAALAAPGTLDRVRIMDWHELVLDTEEGA